MPLEVFETELREWRVMSDEEVSKCRVLKAVPFSEQKLSAEQAESIRRRTKEFEAYTSLPEAQKRAMAHAEQYAERTMVFAAMFDTAGKDPQTEDNQRRISEYMRLLNFIPTELLRLAVDKAVVDNGIYATVPMPGAIKAALVKILGDRYELQEMTERWYEAKWYALNLLGASFDYAQDDPSFELAEAEHERT